MLPLDFDSGEAFDATGLPLDEVPLDLLELLLLLALAALVLLLVLDALLLC
jgi:hypothetical protein